MSLEKKVDRIEDAILMMKDLLLRHKERLDNHDNIMTDHDEMMGNHLKIMVDHEQKMRDFYAALEESRKDFDFKMNALIDSKIREEIKVTSLETRIENIENK